MFRLPQLQFVTLETPETARQAVGEPVIDAVQQQVERLDRAKASARVVEALSNRGGSGRSYSEDGSSSCIKFGVVVVVKIHGNKTSRQERYEVVRQSPAGLLTTKPHIERLLTDGCKTSNSTRLCILRRVFYIGPS